MRLTTMNTLQSRTINLNSGTFTALRSSNFRIYFIGMLVSLSGTWMQNLAQGYLVFSLTKSELWLGMIACAAGVPGLLLSPFSGLLVDSIPRRKLLIITQVLQMIFAFILAVLTFTELVQPWHIMALAFGLGVVNSVDAPTRLSFVMDVVGRDSLHSGIALSSITNSAARVVGPVAAGFALIAFGPAWCFMLNGLSFLAVIFSLWIMEVPYAIQQPGGSSQILKLRQGFSFARHDPLIAPLLLISTISAFFIVPLIQILPAFADVVLHSPKGGYAAITAGQGFGSVIAGMTTGYLGIRYGRGLLLASGVMLSSVATALLALQTVIPLAAIAAVFSGYLMVTLFVNLNTLLQTTVPDELRGRVLSLYTLTWLGMAPFGSLLLGAIANEIGTPTALLIYAAANFILNGAVLLRWRHVARQA